MANGFDVSTEDVKLIALQEGGNLLPRLKLNKGQNYEETLLKTGAKIKVMRDWSDGRRRKYRLVSYTPDLGDIKVYLELIGQTGIIDILNS